jgi:hypothetical protein
MVVVVVTVEVEVVVVGSGTSSSLGGSNRGFFVFLYSGDCLRIRGLAVGAGKRSMNLIFPLFHSALLLRILTFSSMSEANRVIEEPQSSWKTDPLLRIMDLVLSDCDPCCNHRLKLHSDILCRRR